MSTTIKYQNEYFQFITNQQVSNLADYNKLFYVNGILKKEETYYDNQLWGGVYYLSDTENAADVLAELGSHLKWSLVVDIQIINGYTVQESRFYDENLNQETFYSKNVKNNKGQIVAAIRYDVQTNQAITGFKSFYFGGQQIPNEYPDVIWQEDAEGIFEFDDNGNLEHISFNIDWIKDDEDWESIAHFQLDAGGFINDMMPPEVFNYFTNLEPLVPPF